MNKEKDNNSIKKWEKVINKYLRKDRRKNIEARKYMKV